MYDTSCIVHAYCLSFFHFSDKFYKNITIFLHKVPWNTLFNFTMFKRQCFSNFNQDSVTQELWSREEGRSQIVFQCKYQFFDEAFINNFMIFHQIYISPVN